MTLETPIGKEEIKEPTEAEIIAQLEAELAAANQRIDTLIVSVNAAAAQKATDNALIERQREIIEQFKVDVLLLRNGVGV